LGLDEKSARHHIEIAEGLYSRVQQRVRNTESGNEAAQTPEFIALTQQLYASYLKVRANAIDDVNNYLATTNAAFIKYDLAERMMRLGEVAAVGQISAKSELYDAKITSSLLSSNIDSLDTMITTAKYSGYAGDAILIGTGVGTIAVVGRRLVLKYGAEKGTQLLVRLAIREVVVNPKAVRNITRFLPNSYIFVKNMFSSVKAFNYTMREVRKRWWGGNAPVRPNSFMPKGIERMELSHTYFDNNGFIGKYISDFIKNRGWNLKAMWGSEHALVDPSRYQFMKSVWKDSNPIKTPLRRLFGRMPTSHKVGAGVVFTSAMTYFAYSFFNEATDSETEEEE